jgi:hypothetical protein
MDAKHVSLLRRGFDAYLARLDGTPASLLPYDFDQIDRHRWSMLGGEMVKDELREITNILNGWHVSLLRWRAWNEVLAGFDEQDRWQLRLEFVEALAHQCLLQPSAIRDSLTFIATNGLHQVRLAAGNGYRDKLEGDPEAPGKPPKHLTRRKKEERLERLMAQWPESRQFLERLHRIDDSQYRQSTFDYRNRSSHAIGPRLAIGFTRVVTRTVVPATEMVQQPNGTFMRSPMPGKVSVSYGFGGTPPLDMDKAQAANFDQHLRARSCFECYRSLLAGAMATLPLVKAQS